jgi:hypothetical protein
MMDAFLPTPSESAVSQQGKKRPRVNLLSKYQRELSSAFRACGYEALRSELLNTAKIQMERSPKTQSWPKLLEFGNSDSNEERDWLSLYLASMDRRFLQALIDGQIGRKMFEDKEFRYNVENVHKLKPTPQIYLNTFQRSEFSAVSTSQEFQALEDNEVQKWAGWGVSPKELEKALSLMEAYLDHKSEDLKTQELAEGVDAMMVLAPALKLSEHAQNVGRKYLPSPPSVIVITDWVDKIRKRILQVALKEMEPEQLQEPFPWCFQEVGFGQHGAARGLMNVFHDGTNYLFGLFTACLMKLYPRVFEIKAFAVMDVWKPEHADSCEILGSLCGGTYGQGDWMGLNPSWAGGNSMNGKNGLLSEDLIPHFERNQEDAGKSGVFEKNWDEDLLVQERFRRVCRVDMKELEAKVVERKKKLEEAKNELARVQSFVSGVAKHRKLVDFLESKRKSAPCPVEGEPKAKIARMGELETREDTEHDAMLDSANLFLQS